MKSWPQRIALSIIALLVLLAAWVWWNRPETVDMSAYVPAETLIYLEANSLPDIVTGLTSTDAWQSLAPPAGLSPNFGKVGWLSRLSAWSGIGSAETVVFSRTQAAVAVLGFDVTDESSTVRDIKPRIALVAETHTGARRVQAAITKLVGNYARRKYGEPSIQQQDAGATTVITWTTPDGKRKIIAAISESVAIVGNDEETVRACLAVRRGERASLADDAQLAEMRLRMNANASLAFGYVSPAGARRLLETAAMIYFGQLPSDPNAQSAAAILIPQLAGRILGGAAWSSRIAEGAVVDNYYFNLQNELAARLQTSLATSGERKLRAADLLPADTNQLTIYNYREPEAAWRGLNAAISSQLEITIAPFVGRFLDELLVESLKPFGVDAPHDFLRAAGAEIATVRLDDEGESLLLIASIRDREALQSLVRKRLGAGAKSLRVGDAEMLVAADGERGAASFVGDYLIMGGADDVRRCLQERAASRTLGAAGAFQQAARFAPANDASNVVTYTNDYHPARRFISFISRQSGARSSSSTPPNAATLQRSLSALPYAFSETRLVEGGFEKTTRSTFGQFGGLVVQLATDAEADK
ncbi:MAG TPA: hypothetical protein VGX24_14765 [Pyrinomonadaceae bacterium]|jgi:hypothetical protein|nr:hypothetical protein [Pyrinomonadaceae bacterium]